jgi:hypothetical protein
MLRDVAFAAVGGLLMLFLCGGFASANGGEFFFFMPQVRFAQTVRSTDYKAHGYAWMKDEPQLLLPLFALAVLVPLVLVRARRWRNDAAVRFAGGSVALLGLPVVVVCTWEFARDGDFLEVPYYFSLFNLGLSCVLASACYLVFWDNRKQYSLPGRAGTILAGMLAVALPTFLLYKAQWGSFGVSGSRITLGLMVVAAALAAIATLRSRRVGWLAAPAAVLVLLFAVGYGSASGSSTRGIFATTPLSYEQNTHALSLGVQLISFMRDNGFQDAAPPVPGTSLYPEFWYDINADEAFNAMNAMYLWAYTWAGQDLPHIDKAMRGVLDARRPSVLVLLCTTRECVGARAALTRAGYANRLVVQQQLVSGENHAWAVAVRLLKFARPPAQ